MRNPYDVLPAYIKESPRYSRFLELVNAYLLSGAVELSLFKQGFVEYDKPSYVVKSLADQLNVDVEVPFVNGVPDWKAYYRRLTLAYRAKTFKISTTGKAIDFLLLDHLNDVSSIVVLDFSVLKDSKSGLPVGSPDKSPMSVVYSVLAMVPDLTFDIVRNYLIPNVTGVRSTLYYLQFGQEVFGFDADELKGKHLVKNDVTGEIVEVDIDDAPYVVASASIRDLGNNYEVGDVIETVVTDEFKESIQFKITDLFEGAYLSIVNPTKSYKTNPTVIGIPIKDVGNKSGMTIDIISSPRRGYLIRGWDDGAFLRIV